MRTDSRLHRPRLTTALLAAAAWLPMAGAAAAGAGADTDPSGLIERMMSALGGRASIEEMRGYSWQKSARRAALASSGSTRWVTLGKRKSPVTASVAAPRAVL